MVRTEQEMLTDIATLNLESDSKKQLLENVQDTFNAMSGNSEEISQLKEDNTKLNEELENLKKEYIKRFTEPASNSVIIKQQVDDDIIEQEEKKYINVTKI